MISKPYFSVCFCEYILKYDRPRLTQLWFIYITLVTIYKKVRAATLPPSPASKSARGKYAINSRRKSSKLIWPTRELAVGESWSQPTNHRVQQTIYHHAFGLYHHIYSWDLKNDIVFFAGARRGGAVWNLLICKIHPTTPISVSAHAKLCRSIFGNSPALPGPTASGWILTLSRSS